MAATSSMSSGRRGLPSPRARRGVSALLVACALALTIPDASATIVRYRTIRSMAGVADAIVRGKVVRSVAIWRDRTAVTQTTIQVSHDYSRTPLRERTIVVESPGGTVGDIAVHVSGTPAFKLGDEVVVFLRRHPSGRYRSIGLSLGVFQLRRVSGEWFAVRQTGRLRVVQSATKSTVVKPMPTFHLDDLIEEILVSTKR